MTDQSPSREAVERLREAVEADEYLDGVRLDHSDALTILALLTPATQPDRWQSIDTAPRDNTVFILAFRVRGEDAPIVREARWEPTKESPTSVNGFLIYDTGIAWQPMPAFARFERDHLTPATQPNADREAKVREALESVVSQINSGHVVVPKWLDIEIRGALEEK